MFTFDKKEIERILDEKVQEVITQITSSLNIKTTTISTEKEIADMLKISKRTLLNMRKSGGLPKDSYFYIGRSVRYKKENLINYFSANTI
tara:strand:+ start:254 stop:523 length:270 start_codon:yes stop_codon:yes gene_type:complete